MLTENVEDTRPSSIVCEERAYRHGDDSTGIAAAEGESGKTRPLLAGRPTRPDRVDARVCYTLTENISHNQINKFYHQSLL